MTNLAATLGASDAHYRCLGVSKNYIECWEDGMRTDGGKGTYEWWYFDAYLNDGSKLAITFRTKPIIDVGKALDPWIDLNLERADGTSMVRHLHIEPHQFAASQKTCDVTMASNTFKGDLHTYSIHVESEEMVVDAFVTGTTSAWRPETGCLFFGEREEYYFAWLPSVPQGDAHVSIALSGGEPRHYTGIGYHDHNWGNISMLKLMHDWYWARGTIANYTLIASYITAERRYGSKNFPVFMLARDGKVIADDATKVRFSTRDVAMEPDTGKPVANQVIYEYIDGTERYVLTFTREKDLLHYKFIEELHGIKALLAWLLRVDGAYLRFTGQLSLEHYQADTLVETHRDEALWELMYFGHTRRK
ncbi:MAG: hydroxyneurosporene dehydrogenase [Chloroflexota bacterium]|nr:hydroxyneurosporene dehydrogenase [Chloroflexota bacterium]